VILFDMAKGDLAGNRDLVRAIQGRVVTSPNSPIPLDVLYIRAKDRNEIADAAMRFRESFCRIPKNKLGAVQQDSLREAASNAFQAHELPIEIDAIRQELLVRTDSASLTVFRQSIADFLSPRADSASLSPQWG
jgi:hypothetical protein